MVVACGAKWRAAAPPGSDDQATAAPGKLIIEAKSVVPLDFASGKPERCALVYAVFNNTGAKLTGADLQLRPYSIHVPPLPAYAQFMDDLSASAAPVGGSCVGAADAVARAPGGPITASCSLNGHSDDDCASRLELLVDLDKTARADVARVEAAASAAYALEQVRLFAQAKAQAWVTRGPYQAAVGTTLVAANPATAISFPGVAKDDYDPHGAAGVAAAPSMIVLCPWRAAPADAQVSPGRLLVLRVYRDVFGLADWYRLQVVCQGALDKTAWVRAPTVERLMRSSQLVRQTAAPPDATPSPTPAQPEMAK